MSRRIKIFQPVAYKNCVGAEMALRADKFMLRLIFHNVPSHSASRDRVGAGQIHLPRAATAGEVAVLSADDDLIWPLRYARPSVNTGATTGFNYDCASLVEDIQIALLDAVITRVLGAELNIKLATLSHAPALLQSV